MSDWGSYLSVFHAERAGITSAVLSQCRPDPYAWAFADLTGAIVDVACGDGVLFRTGSGYVGVDLSWAELGLARGRGAPVAQASSVALPFADGSADTVTCSMALQLLPLAPSLSEIARVLRPGGRLLALVPVTGPLPLRERWRWLRLGLRVPDYPNADALTAAAFDAAGLHLVEDDTMGFEYAGPGDLLVRSLYLPGVDPGQVSRAQARARSWRPPVVVPLRRLVAVR